MKIWMLVKSNMKKNRSSSITLVLLIMLATLFMNIGLNVVTKLNTFMDQKKESLNGADYVLMAKKSDQEAAAKLLKSLSGYEDMSAEDAVLYSATRYYNEKRDEKAQSMGLLLLDLDEDRKYCIYKPLEAGKELKENSIVVPYSMKSNNGYEVGDTLQITIDKNSYEFEIYAFSEDVFFATPMNISMYKCFIPHEMFKEMYQSVGEFNQQFYACVKLADGYSDDDFEQNFTNQAALLKDTDMATSNHMSFTSMKVGTTATTGIIMAVLVMFAVLIIIIALIVIRFSVISYIEEDIRNIGSMEAIGFTYRMLRKSMILQFFLITCVGFLFGTVVSFLGTGIVDTFVRIAIGLNWKLEISFDMLMITFISIMLLVMGVTYQVTRRLRRVTPIMALRNGTQTFHFDKNHLPLESTRGNLNLILGLKGIFNNKKRNISICIISILTSLSITTVLSLYRNLVLQPTIFRDMIGIEETDIAIVDHKEDYLDYFDQLSKKEGLRKTFRYATRGLTIKHGEEQVGTTVRICNDYPKLQTNILAEGRNPEYENEIALSYSVKDQLKAQIGDVVQLAVEDRNYEYVVVGFLQHICYLGSSACISEAGMLRCDSKYRPDQIYLYLEDGYEVGQMMEELKPEVLARGGEIINIKEGFQATLIGFNKGIKILTMIVCLITGMITVLILFYLVKMKITKERVSLGILKAVGFTNRQLMLQTLISFALVVSLSSVIGIILGSIGLNPLFSTILSSMSSIKQTRMVTDATTINCTMLIILVVSVATTIIVSMRIRKVEPRELIIE